MASMRFENDRGRQGWRIRFYVGKARRAVWLTGVTEPEAHIWKLHIEQLLACSVPPKATTAWVGSLSDDQRSKLAAVGLVEKPAEPVIIKPTGPTTLKSFVDWYIGRRHVKKATSQKWIQTRDSLVRYFGADRDITTITNADAEAWREWLAASGNNREGKPRKATPTKKAKANEQVEKPKRTDLGDNTVRRRTGIAKQFFRYAIKANMIAKNPFDGLAQSVHGNEARQFFVSIELFNSIIDVAPNAEWEAVIALSRLGGLRCPSETLRLKWEDVDFAGGRIRIHASKTEHHKDGGIRDCPLFPELRPFLESLADLAKARGALPTDFVITGLRGSESYLRTRFLKILKRAGVAPWPKLFHNMRASRETELLDEFPIKDVCGWIGNSQAVAMKHYAMRRQDSFVRASGGLSTISGSGGPIGGPITWQEQADCGNADGGDAAKKSQKSQGNRGILQLAATAGDTGQNDENGRRGPRTDRQKTRQIIGETSQCPADLPTAVLTAVPFDLEQVFSRIRHADEKTQSAIIEAILPILNRTE